MVSSALTRLLRGAVLAAVGPLLYSQQTVNNASINGRVTDLSGAMVEDAQVTARQLDTGISTVVNTGRDGRFRFPYLRVGGYTITVHHPGFANMSLPLNLTAGSAFELPISLQIATSTTDITGEQAATLETARMRDYRHGRSNRD